MASIDFQPSPVAHAPSPFGFGFALKGTPSTLQHAQASHLTPVIHHPPPPPSHFALPSTQMPVSQGTGHANSVRASQKRRFEHDEDEDDHHDGGSHRDSRKQGASGDSVMHGRSPTPERPRRIIKRLRLGQQAGPSNADTRMDGSGSSKSPDDDVDVGVLLASIPPQSHRQILTSLLASQPSLKSLILQFIPRPTLETALEALDQCAKRLKDAYPYSHGSLPSSIPPPFSSSSTSFGFGNTSSLGFGFGSAAPGGRSSFGSQLGQAGSSAATNGMRDSYILSRLRPALQEYIATAQSYLPYFSMIPPSAITSPGHNSAAPSFIRSQQSAATPTDTPQDKVHPTESFLFLAHLTSHIISFPSILSQPQTGSPNTPSSTSTLLTEHLIPRVLQEWRGWMDHIDRYVNQEGGMFSLDTVKGWGRSLDEFAGDASPPSGFGALGYSAAHLPPTTQGQGLPGMKDIRDRWLSRVGWLLGRQPTRYTTNTMGNDMEEEEEL